MTKRKLNAKIIVRNVCGEGMINKSQKKQVEDKTVLKNVKTVLPCKEKPHQYHTIQNKQADEIIKSLQEEADKEQFTQESMHLVAFFTGIEEL